MVDCCDDTIEALIFTTLGFNKLHSFIVQGKDAFRIELLGVTRYVP